MAQRLIVDDGTVPRKRRKRGGQEEEEECQYDDLSEEIEARRDRCGYCWVALRTVYDWDFG